MWSCAFAQNSSSLPPWMTYPHVQTILSATADLLATVPRWLPCLRVEASPLS
jgi:hypothetical protein